MLFAEASLGFNLNEARIMSKRSRIASFLAIISSMMACLGISDVSARPGDIMSHAQISDVLFENALGRQSILKVTTSELNTEQLSVPAPADNGSNSSFLFALLNAMLLVLMGLCGFFAYLHLHSKKRLHEFNVAAKKILSGDYAVEIDGATERGEFGHFAKKLTMLRDNLHQVNKDSQVANFHSSAVDGSSVAIMMVDRDFIVTYINEATKKLLADNAEVFRETWPSFNPDAIIGSCIDMFHKNPAHQRQLLANPESLPFRTDISVGNFKFGLNVSGVFDSAGDYVGNVLEWNDVTTIRINEGKLDALDRSQAVIEFDLDGTIVDANQNFLDVMGYDLQEIVGRRHRIFVDDEYAKTAEYGQFWEDLVSGRSTGGLFERRAKNGEPRFVRATYNSIRDGNGKIFKIVKFAVDATETETQLAQDKEERERSTAEQELVVSGLAEGLRKLSHGDFNTLLEQEFPEDYVQLRDDFNAAVAKLKSADIERKDLEKRQELVVTSLATGLNRLAEGELTKPIDTVFSEEYEQLRQDFNDALKTLETVVKTITGTADGMKNQVGKLSDSSKELSHRTESQAATLEETAAALDEITAAVQQTAEGASQTSSAVEQTRGEAQESSEIVRLTVDAMGEIETSSRKISQIIGVIDDIAFQTNLLALNAGVEAARAGDAGRGFAVVAQEVRALAQRSSGAAKEIKTLISSSTEQVEKGVELVGRTGQALTEIVERVEDISKLVTDMASSAKEQSASLSEVNSAVNKMDQATQQNAAMVEETTAASESLNNNADELLHQISHFNITRERRGGARNDRREPIKSPVSSSSSERASTQASVAEQTQQVRAYASARNGAAAAEKSVDIWEEF